MLTSKTDTIESFGLQPGRVLAGKYEVLSLLGSGYQGEVYLVQERKTGIERAAKIFFPHRNPKDRTSTTDARKLHKLRSCPVLIQYLNQEKLRFRKREITCLISEFVEGQQLSDFLKKQPGKRLTYFEGLHLLYALAKGMEPIHRMGEYHGDLHIDNVMIRRIGIGFEVKVLDLYHWWGTKKENIREDVLGLIEIFHSAIGGRKQYAKHPEAVKKICCGLKKTLIAKKFKTAGELRAYLETMEWA
jgi:serine/threonine protein kinase